jgi:hypothetical protein
MKKKIIAKQTHSIFFPVRESRVDIKIDFLMAVGLRVNERN